MKIIRIHTAFIHKQARQKCSSLFLSSQFLHIHGFLLIIFSVLIWSAGKPEVWAQVVIPSVSVEPLSSDAPAPWGINPDTLSGVQIDAVVESAGFLQQRVTLENGDRFFHQRIDTVGFSSESYTRESIGLNNDPEGNLIFKQVISEPASGLTDTTMINGFRQPIQIHFDLVESKVAALTGGLNQIDVHFRQIPFRDTATQKVLVRQEVGVWTTSFSGLMPTDISADVDFTLRGSDLSHETALSIPSNSSFATFHPVGTIDFWADLEMVKVIDPINGQLIALSRCGDFGDPTGRLDGGEGRFQDSGPSRGGCSGGNGSPTLTRPDIPDHDNLDFQLSPIVWERFNNQPAFGSGLNTVFPRP